MLRNDTALWWPTLSSALVPGPAMTRKLGNTLFKLEVASGSHQHAAYNTAHAPPICSNCAHNFWTRKLRTEATATGQPRFGAFLI